MLRTNYINILADQNIQVIDSSIDGEPFVYKTVAQIKFTFIEVWLLLLLLFVIKALNPQKLKLKCQIKWSSVINFAHN